MPPEIAGTVPAAHVAAGLVDFRAPWDLPVFQALNGQTSAAVDAATRLLSSRAFGLAFALGCAALLLVVLRRRAWPRVLALGLAVAITDLVGARVLKPLFHRLRPCYALPPGAFRHVLIAANQGSLPSLHAANAFAVAAVLSLTVPAGAPLALLVAALISLSRVVGGVHWPSDILAGALYGTALGSLAAWGSRSVERKLTGSLGMAADTHRRRGPDS